MGWGEAHRPRSDVATAARPAELTYEPERKYFPRTWDGPGGIYGYVVDDRGMVEISEELLIELLTSSCGGGHL